MQKVISSRFQEDHKMKNNKIASVIISAGYSSRMKSFKPFLKFGETTTIEKVVDTHMRAGIKDIYVVVGHRGAEVIEKLKYIRVTCVLNENYSEGMFSSIQKGVEALDESIDAFFMQPVDIPLIKEHTLEVLISEYLRSEKGIVYPTFCKQKGHPPLIDCKYNEIIRSSDREGGLKRLLAGFESDVLYVPVSDEAILRDMDTQEDYEKLCRFSSNETE